jgi:hypothetical protein
MAGGALRPVVPEMPMCVERWQRNSERLLSERSRRAVEAWHLTAVRPATLKNLIPAVFGKDDMKLLVQCASRASETEDRYLADCFKARGWKGHEHGICENQVECYYQFLIS